MTYTNYFFDLYGTLIDVHTDEHAAQTWKKWLRVLDRKGIQHPGYIEMRRTFFRMDKEARLLAAKEGSFAVPEIDVIPIYEAMFASYGNKQLTKELLDELSYEFRKASRSHICLFPGVVEYLEQIRANGGKSYIVSNAQRSYTWPEIVEFGLDKLTDDQIISSDFGCMKPDPAFFQVMIDRHQLAKDTILMHGDSYENDVQGATLAGIDAVHLAKENAPEHYYLDQLSREQ